MSPSFAQDLINEGIGMIVDESLKPLNNKLDEYKKALNEIVALQNSPCSEIMRWRIATEIAEEALK